MRCGSEVPRIGPLEPGCEHRIGQARGSGVRRGGERHLEEVGLLRRDIGDLGQGESRSGGRSPPVRDDRRRRCRSSVGKRRARAERKGPDPPVSDALPGCCERRMPIAGAVQPHQGRHALRGDKPLRPGLGDRPRLGRRVQYDGRAVEPGSDSCHDAAVGRGGGGGGRTRCRPSGTRGGDGEDRNGSNRACHGTSGI